MTALTKASLAEKLFEELGLNKREAKEDLAFSRCDFSRTLVTLTPKIREKFKAIILKEPIFWPEKLYPFWKNIFPESKACYNKNL